MKSLANPEDRAELMARLEKLNPQSQGKWGRMNANQMMCHLSDAFKLGTGERTSANRANLFTTTIMKWATLQSNAYWPRGFKTAPEADQEISGTRPTEFFADKQELERTLEHFATNAPTAPHPVLGKLSHAEWQRWGYLHMDYHLKQFGL